MDYYKIIKEELINNEVYKKVKDYSKNKSDLRTYYNVGKILIEAQGGEKRAKYGDQLIKEYSVKLTEELGKKYSITNLKYMRQFYLFQKSQTLSDQLTWSHYCELLSMKDINEINYYIDICEKQNLSVRELRNKIKNKEYERLDENTKLKLTNSKEENKIGDFIKHPIVIKTDKEIISEKILHQVILENIVSFMKELGEGYSTKSLKRMRQFYLFCKKGSAMPTQLNWSHYCEVGKILSKTGGKYGDNVINKCSNKLMIEVGKKYNERTLFRMK